jgi:hypothetical protein
MVGPEALAGVRSDSGMITVPPQYAHFIVKVPTSGSSGAPQDGHLNARKDGFFSMSFPRFGENFGKHTLVTNYCK